MSDDQSYFGFIKTAVGWCGAVGGVVSSLVGFIKLVTGDGGLVFQIAALLGFLLLWASCFYLYFVTRKIYRPFPHNTSPEKVKAFPASVRTVALWGMFVVPLLGLSGFGVYAHYKNQTTDKIIVAVARFQSLNPIEIGTTNTLISELRSATQAYQDVTIKALGKEITEEDPEAADRSGQEEKATIVIWGWHDNLRIKAYFVLLPKNRNYLSVLGNRLPMNLMLAGRESFDVQMDLSNDVAFFTLLTVGLARFESRDYLGAIKLIQDGLGHVSTQTSGTYADKEARIAIGNYYLGRAFSDQGNYNEAKARYEEALKHKPDYELAHLYLGHLHRLLMNDAAAISELDQAINRYDSLIKQSPNNVDLLNIRAWALSSRAASEFTLATSAAGQKDNVRATGLRNKAKEDTDQAFADYSKVIELQPTNALAFNNRGLFYYQRNEFDRALADFNAAVSFSPGDASPLNNRGTTYSRMGRFPEALADYERVIELRPSSPSYLSRAFVYLDQRDYKSAIVDYTRAIEYEPTNFRAYRNRGWSHLFLGNFQQAAADSQKFLELKSPCNKYDQYMYVAILNYVSLRKTSIESANRSLEQSLAACGPPPSPWPYAILRFFHREIDARQLEAEAGTGNGELTEAHAYIGMESLFSGRTEEAKEHFKWVKDNGDQTYDEYPMVLSELSRLQAGGK